jgi:hypothetical protein
MSVLHDKINSYALERGLEFDETYSLTPTRTGSATYSSSNKTGTGTITYNSGVGPVGGSGSWSFPVVTAAARFILTDSTAYVTDGDYGAGMWVKHSGTISGGGTVMNVGTLGTNQVGTSFVIIDGPSNTVRFRFRNGNSAETNYGPNWTADQWYYVAFRRLGTAGLEIYINGNLEGTLANTNAAGTGGHNLTFGSNNTVSTTSGANISISNFHIGPSSVFTAAVIKEIYNTGIGIAVVDVEPMVVTTSVAMMPTIVAAQTVSYGASPMTVDAAFADPLLALDFGTTTVYPMEANPSSFVMPTITAVNVVNISVSADPMTASGEFNDPEANIGDDHIAASLDASALFVMPLVIIIKNNSYTASPMVADTTDVTDPTITTQLRGVAAVEPMTARVMSPMPPAFKQLTDDMWYNRLYNQHAVPVNDRIIYTSVANDTGVNVARAFMKLFDDVTSNKTGESTEANRLYSNIPYKFTLNDPSSTETSTTLIWNPSVNNFTTGQIPLLETGYFDDYGRKAVRFRNINFNSGGNSQELNGADRAYTFEFSFKSTKSNQVIASGNRQPITGTGFRHSTIGLLDGKLYGMTNNSGFNSSSTTAAFTFSHPDNYAFLSTVSQANPKLLVGNKRIDDGQWHHIVIQSESEGAGGRVQYWIDGELDIQSFFAGPYMRPMNFGWNSNTTRYQSDFETSVWSYDPGPIVSQRDIKLNYYSYINFISIQPEPMTNASATMPQDVAVVGNRARALYLYFEPLNQFNVTGTEFDISTDPLGGQISVYDEAKNPPPVWYDYDVFPVDVTGRYVSEIVKPEAYGGAENIIPVFFASTPTGSKTLLVNRKGSFRNTLTDAPRYLDILNDVDIAKFDVILFHNYPDQTFELDRTARNESVDSYFGIIEKDIFEDFVKSVRDAVDSGISLLVTNPQLALDLGIIDRYEVVSQLNDKTINQFYSDTYAPTLIDTEYPLGGNTYWSDASKNNKHRLLNTVPNLTDWPAWIWKNVTSYIKDNVYFQDFLGFSRKWDSVEWRENGLQPGDEFLIYGTTNNAGYTTNEYNILAVPAANVKAGVAVTGLANTYVNGLETNENPYKDYVTTIAVRPGDTLNGTQCGGKIFVNFVELATANEYDHAVELLTDERIDLAYAAGVITLTQANQYKASEFNYDRRLAAGTITQSFYNTKLKPWTYNASHDQIQGFFQIDNAAPIGIDFTNPSALVGKSGKSQTTRITNAGTVGSGTFRFNSLPFANLRSGTTFPLMGAYVPSMLTRGFWWLSDRIALSGKVIRPTALESSALMVMPVVTTDKISTFTATPMIANATIGEAGAKNSRNNVVIPMEASALMNGIATNIKPTPFIASALFGNNYRIFTITADDVVVYIHHEDPILYVREDVIK